jgi:hypothetical protein
VSGYAARAADVGAAADAELARAWADSPRVPPAPDRPGHVLLVDEQFTGPDWPAELSRYAPSVPPGSHQASAWWHPSRWARREPGVASLEARRGTDVVIPQAYRSVAADAVRTVSAGGGMWLPSPRWPEDPARPGKALGLLYGRLEVRMRWEPDTPGAVPVGMVWWLYPADQDARPWPSGTELDVVETGAGDRQQITVTLHHGPTAAKRKRIVREYDVDATRWHTYGLTWEPGRYAGDVDGVPAWEIRDPAVPSWPMVPGWQTEALAVGDATAGQSAAMHLSSVRVWQVAPTPAPASAVRR